MKHRKDYVDLHRTTEHEKDIALNMNLTAKMQAVEATKNVELGNRESFLKQSNATAAAAAEPFSSSLLSLSFELESFELLATQGLLWVMEGNDDQNLKAIKASVGRLVWVRLRNASWWPAQTLLLEQLPQTSSSPQLGTPIKLLGRDDVNVEWYVLEKSKSVKAFRCGDYDSHIDKAMAVAAAKAASNKKKTAKLTRRENAINIALQIENAHLCSSSPGAEEDGLDSAMSFQETLLKVQPKRRRTPNDSEDEGIKRMRGLEDIGKEHVGAIVVYRQEVGSNCGDSVSNGGDKACSPLSLKRKRSQVVINANDCSKRKNRRRQLTKVLESTAMVCVPVTSGMEPVESMKSVSAVINNSSDSTGVSCENVVGAKAKDSDISSLSVSAEDDPSYQLYDVPLTGKAVNGSACSTNPPDTQLVIYDLNRIEKSTSEWQLKGKRNSRQMSKKQEARRFVYGEEANNNSSLPLPALFEVKIEVKASSNKPRVPLVSRMSELNGKAIVGHPVSVEALKEEGYCNGKLMSQDVVKAKPLLSEKKSKKRKSQAAFGKSKKKSSSSVSIKIRRLSTLTSQKLTGRSKMQTTGKAKETVVACIPLKVVFSRINQVLKGSARQTQHRPLPPSVKA
uniref:PWWP domain-containing protein n=2 Tax=Brassica campestris TaxID=3711 RepID=M4ENQ0_BRACM